MMEVDQESSLGNILSKQLPSVVVDELLEYLDFYTFQTLRLVCKATKSWMETPERLRHFVVRITGEARLDEVLGAPDPVPWNNFAFTEKYATISEADVQRFLAAYGDLVEDLTFNWKCEHEWPHLQLRLLSSCPSLESLKATELNFNLISNDVANQLLQNWKNLRHFHVELFYGSPNTETGQVLFFSRLLAICTHLNTLRIPIFKNKGMSEYEYYSIHDRHCFQRVVRTPLLDTIPKGNLRSIEVPEGNNFLNNQLRLRLGQVCRESGVVLRGFDFIRNLPPEHILSLLDVIGDVDKFTDAIIRHPLRNVRTIRLHSGTFGTFEDRTYTMPPFPHLTFVDLAFRIRDSESLAEQNCVKAMELFVDRLIEMRRHSVKRLRVVYDLSTRHSPVDLCTSFVNLRSLNVTKWMGEDEEWLKLWPLLGRTLVELYVFDCPNLSDRGILGDDLNKPAILQLNQLRKLGLVRWNMDPGNERITELSFNLAFCHMRLRTFLFFQGKNSENYTRPISTKTLKAMWDGPFGETIERCDVQGDDLMLRIDPRELSWMERIYLFIMAIIDTVVSFLDLFK